MSQQSEVFYSGTKVIVDTLKNGVIDISDDVISVSVNRRMDGVSTASVSLLNYSSRRNGEYNGVIHVGDRVYIAFVKQWSYYRQEIPSFTGRVSMTPVVSYQDSAYTFSCADCIQDLQYIYWDKYSTQAFKRYQLSAQNEIMSGSGGGDSGIAAVLTDFLAGENGVCHFPKEAVKIYNFPNLSGSISNIISTILSDYTNIDYESYAEALYDLLFGSTAMSNNGPSEIDEKQYKSIAEAWEKMLGNVDPNDPMGIGFFDLFKYGTTYVRDDTDTNLYTLAYTGGDPLVWGKDNKGFVNSEIGGKKVYDILNSAYTLPVKENGQYFGVPDMSVTINDYVNDPNVTINQSYHDKIKRKKNGNYDIKFVLDNGDEKSYADYLIDNGNSSHVHYYDNTASPGERPVVLYEPSGCYGLTAEDMKAVDSNGYPAFMYDKDTQYKALKAKLSKCNGISDSMYYLMTGKQLKDWNGSSPLKMDQSGSTIAAISIKNSSGAGSNARTYLSYSSDPVSIGGSNKNVSDFSNMMQSLTNNVALTDDKSSGDSAQPGIQNDFSSWCQKYMNHGTYGDPVDDGYGNYTGQCWSLWRRYYDEFLCKHWGVPSGTNWIHQKYEARLRSSVGDAMQQTRSDYESNTFYVPDHFMIIDNTQQLSAGDVVFLAGDSNYGHVAIAISDSGNTVHVINQNVAGGAGTTQSVKYTDFPKSQVHYALRPYTLFGKNGGKSVTMSNTPIPSDVSPDSSTEMSAQNYARNETFKLFKLVNLYNPTKMIESEVLGSTDNSKRMGMYLANDEQALGYVSTCCKASLRSFCSTPDGAFAAFVPDWWGMLDSDNTRKATLDVPAVEMIDFKATIDKSSYVSHYFLTTEEATVGANANGFTSALSNLSQLYKLMTSHGVVTMQYQGEALMHLMDISATGCSSLEELMKRWGISVKVEDNSYIQQPELASLYALYQFLKYWANCFRTSISMTFRPEIIPGIRLHIPDEGLSLYVESATHSWNANSGGATSVSVTSPVNDSGKVGVGGK